MNYKIKYLIDADINFISKNFDYYNDNIWHDLNNEVHNGEIEIKIPPKNFLINPYFGYYIRIKFRNKKYYGFSENDLIAFSKKVDKMKEITLDNFISDFLLNGTIKSIENIIIQNIIE